MPSKRNRKKSEGREAQPAHAYQEGSVESIGGRPSGTDDGDRSGDGTVKPAGKRPKQEKGRDSFTSSEITEKTTTPGKDPRTRS